MQTPLIYVFSLAYPPYVGGAEIALREIARRIPALHFRIYTAYALKRFERPQQLVRTERSDNIEIVRVGPANRYISQYGYPFFAMSRALRDAKYNAPAAVWGMVESYGGIAAFLFNRQKPKIPYVLTMQSGDSEQFWRRRTWFWLPFYKKIFKAASRVQAISQFLASRAQSLGASPTSISVIPNGIDEKLFQAPIAEEYRNTVRDRMRVPRDAFCVFSASRLENKNGIDTLIEGYALWSLKNPKVSSVLVIAGRGTLESHLKQLALKKGIADRVRFLGEIPYKSLPEYYKSADVFVRVSRSEGLGNSFLEAMAAGIPVIGTPVGGITDFLHDKKTGLLVKPDDADGLAFALERMRTDEDLKKAVNATAKIAIAERYTWDRVAEEMENLLKGLYAA